MERLAVFQEALTGCERLRRIHPQSVAFASIAQRLPHLMDLESGMTTDRTKLQRVNVGVLAAREVEALDRALAELLHSAAAAA